MPTPSLVNGNIWTPELANASVRPFIETDTIAGTDDPGSVPQVQDENLNPSPLYLRAKFYGWYDRMQISVQSGLTIAYSGCLVMKPDAASVGTVNPGTLILPNDQTNFVYIDWTGISPVVSFSSTLPYSGAPLAAVVTSGGAITQLIDLRYQKVEQIRPISLPPQTSAWVTGDIKPTLRPTPEAGWLFLQGQLISRIDYPALFEIFGYSQGGSGNSFRLPDGRGKNLVGVDSASGLSLWDTGGSANKKLTVSEMPVHSHGITDPGHVHVTTESPHVHAVVDNGHSHALADPGHRHSIDDPGHEHRAENHRGASLNDDSTDEIGAEISTQGEGALMPIRSSKTGIRVNPALTGMAVGQALTGIGMASARTNLNVNNARSGISVNSQGGGAEFSLRSPYLVCNWQIKT